MELISVLRRAELSFFSKNLFFFFGGGKVQSFLKSTKIPPHINFK